MKALVLLILLASCNCRKRVVGKVGACDRLSICDVVYTDGTHGFEKLPYLGMEVENCE